MSDPAQAVLKPAQGGTARRLGAGSMLRVASLVVTTVASLILVPVLVHAFGDRTYGLWSLTTTFIGYYSLLELGLGGAITRHVAGALGSKDQGEANQIYATALTVYCGLGVAVLLISLVAAAFCGFFIPQASDAATFRRLVILLGASVACAFPIRVLIGILNAGLRFDLTAFLDILTVALRTGLMLAVAHAHLSIVWLAWSMFLAQLPKWILAYVFVRRDLPYLDYQRRLFDRLIARKLFSYGGVSFVAQIADMLRFQVDSFVVAGFIGLAAVTHYNIAGSLAQYYISLSIAAMGTLVPVFSQKQGEAAHDEIKKTFFLGTKVGIVFASFIGWGLVAWGKPFIERWMGAAYLDAYPPLVALAVGCTFAQWQIVSPLFLYGVSRHKIYAVFNSVEGVANLVLSLILVKPYGLLGVALGTMIPIGIIKLFIQPIYVCRVLKVPVTKYAAEFFRTLAACALGLALPTLITWHFVAPNYRVLVAVGTVSALIYLGVVWKLEFGGEDGNILRRVLLLRESVARSKG